MLLTLLWILRSYIGLYSILSSTEVLLTALHSGSTLVQLSPPPLLPLLLHMCTPNTVIAVTTTAISIRHTTTLTVSSGTAKPSL